MWYEYTCGHRKYTDPRRSSYVKQVNYPCARCVDKSKKLNPRSVEDEMKEKLRSFFPNRPARVAKR